MRLTQEDINEYVKSGGNLKWLSKEQIEAIPQKIINQYVANGGELWPLLEEQIEAIPQEIVNQYVANGGELEDLSEEQIEAIPQEIINQRAANGGELWRLSEEQIEAIPQMIFNPTQKAKDSLILYTIDKLKSQDLPIDVFVNCEIRAELLEVIKKKLKRTLMKFVKKTDIFNIYHTKL